MFGVLGEPYIYQNMGDFTIMWGRLLRKKSAPELMGAELLTMFVLIV